MCDGTVMSVNQYVRRNQQQASSNNNPFDDDTSTTVNNDTNVIGADRRRRDVVAPAYTQRPSHNNGGGGAGGGGAVTAAVPPPPHDPMLDHYEHKLQETVDADFFNDPHTFMALDRVVAIISAEITLSGGNITPGSTIGTDFSHLQQYQAMAH